MSERRKPQPDLSPAQRLAAIDERQHRLLTELDRLNERVEAAIDHFSGGPERVASEA